ncbi:MAG: hypothetical protein ACF8R7_00040 [Phycisphaerales bacterium JB039]
MAEDPLSQTRTRLHRRWLLKMTLGTIALIAIGLWGLYDATIKYPQRGERHAEYMEWQYLQAEKDRAGLSLAGAADPEAELRDLSAMSGESLGQNPELDAKLGWLQSLRTIGRLDAKHTTYGREGRPSAADRLRALTEKWNTSSAPKALAAYDLPLQWAICVGGFALAGWLIALFVKVGSKTYRWDPETRALTLPGGATLKPEDLEDLDKRKWHKFLVTLKVRQEHAQLGGRQVRLDLYRYTPLEEWVLEMERIRFPERAEDAAPAKSGEPAGGESEQTEGSTPERTGADA